MKRLHPTAAAIEEAAVAIRAGGVVAYPTETVYGLGVDPFNDGAVARLIEMKGRDAASAFILIVAEPEDVSGLCESIPDTAQCLMQAFWPGPLSLVLPKAASLSELVTGGRSTVAVRCPDQPVARALCQAVGGPLVSTSLNRSGAAPALDLASVDLIGIAVALDGGVLAPSAPSTVYDVAKGTVLRAGPIPEASIAAALRREGMGPV